MIIKLLHESVLWASLAAIIGVCIYLNTLGDRLTN